MKLKKISSSILASVLALVMIPVAVSAASMTVKDLNSEGWDDFTRETGTIGISDDFGAPAGFGNESVVISTPLGNDKAYAKHAAPNSLKLDDLDKIDYYTYRSATSASTTTPGQTPALNVFVDIDGDGDEDTVLVYEPLYQTGGAAAVVPETWQLWNAGSDAAKWWSTNAIPGALNRDRLPIPTLSEIKAANPDAVVLAYAINQGGGNAGLIGGVDGLSVNDVTYNFEASSAPALTYPATKDDCKNGEHGKFTGKKFKNQGECVSYVASKGKNSSNPIDNFFTAVRSLF